MARLCLLTLVILTSITLCHAQIVPISDVDNKNCAAAVEGLRLCAKASEIKVKAGEPVKLDFTLENVSDKDVEVRERGGFFWDNYMLRVEGENGRLKTKDEIEKERIAAGGQPVPPKIYVKLPLFKGPMFFPLPARKAMVGMIDLSERYDFSAKGRYTVMLVRIERMIDGTEKETALKRPAIGGHRNKRVMLTLVPVTIIVESDSHGYMPRREKTEKTSRDGDTITQPADAEERRIEYYK